MVLRDDPENWEASFNQVYFQAMKCTISEIPTAALNLANNVSTSARLIFDHIGNEDQDAILTEMFIQGSRSEYTVSIPMALMNLLR